MIRKRGLIADDTARKWTGGPNNKMVKNRNFFFRNEFFDITSATFERHSNKFQVHYYKYHMVLEAKRSTL